MKSIVAWWRIGDRRISEWMLASGRKSDVDLDSPAIVRSDSWRGDGAKGNEQWRVRWLTDLLKSASVSDHEIAVRAHRLRRPTMQTSDESIDPLAASASQSCTKIVDCIEV
jgi:hypothetical protein